MVFLPDLPYSQPYLAPKLLCDVRCKVMGPSEALESCFGQISDPCWRRNLRLRVIEVKNRLRGRFFVSCGKSELVGELTEYGHGHAPLRGHLIFLCTQSM